MVFFEFFFLKGYVTCKAQLKANSSQLNANHSCIFASLINGQGLYNSGWNKTALKNQGPYYLT